MSNVNVSEGTFIPTVKHSGGGGVGVGGCDLGLF